MGLIHRSSELRGASMSDCILKTNRLTSSPSGDRSDRSAIFESTVQHPADSREYQDAGGNDHGPGESVGRDGYVARNLKDDDEGCD